MGGAADLPQRSSSPLKRRASDLEAEVPPGQDVDMIEVPPSDPANAATQSTRSRRALSVDMLREEPEAETMDVRAEKPASPKPETDIPPIDTQIKTVTSLCEAAAQAQLQDGDQVYLVSKLWLSRVIARGSEAREHSKEEPQGEIGPVDNSDIIQQIITDCEGKQHVQLKHGLNVESFQLFSEDAWKLVMEWYGLMPGTLPIIRHAHNTNHDKNGIPNVVYEFHPPIFKIHRLWSSDNNLLQQIYKVKKPEAPVFVFSRSERYVDFLKKIKREAGVPMDRKVRVWRVPRKQPAAEPNAPVINTSTPPSSRPSSPTPGITVASREPQDSWTELLLDVTSFLELKRGDGRELVESDDHSNNANYNGHSDLQLMGLGDDQAIVLDEQITAGTDNYVSNYVSKSSKTTTSGTRGLSSLSASQANSGRNSPAPSGYNLRGRSKQGGRALGTVGLSNLGNTCYMNSALQCVRSVEELTKYFLTGQDEEELNTENPLGNNGEVALSYQRLLKEIYREPVPISVAPRNFKNTIGKYAPSFSGYGQQDSQEFLGFLLDGLQEDLSRVKKKPYIEKPDSTDEMVNNPDAIREMAAKVWDITKKRDDSVIADLFTGMYKSTLVCPVCSKISITFDPFNNLTLQLPIENNWQHDIYFLPLNDKPILISVDIDKQASISTMKEYISKKTGVEVGKLFVGEEFKSKIYKTFDNFDAVTEIGSSDKILVFELDDKPTNWPVAKQKKQKIKSMLSFHDSEEEEIPRWDDPLAEKLLVPVFWRHRAEYNRFNKSRLALFPVPHYIVLTPEEARSEDLIQRKILQKAATLSTSVLFTESDEETDPSTTDSVDPDLVLTNGSDSSGEVKVIATSIDGEDGLVDVMMKEPNGTHPSIESDVSQPSEGIFKFNKRPPSFMKPGSYLPADLQNMFQLHYFKTQKELVPLGWSEINEDKTYPTLASRNPQAFDDESSTDLEASTARTGSESSNDDDQSHNNAFLGSTRMNDESSEDELSRPINHRILPVRSAGQKSAVRVGQKQRRKRNLKTYSRKGNQSARKPSSITNPDQDDAPDEGPLIRLGEGIVVDWYDQAYDALFGADGADDTLRGAPTFTSVPKMDDPELDAKQKARSLRRKNGISLDDCLNEFGKEEILSEADTWYCPRCKEHRRATKKFELWKTPDILVMHLKRFSSSTYRRDKLDVFVDFPIDGLDLTSRVVETEDGKEEIYDLFAVDDHWGGLGGGHYTAFAKNFVDQEWYEYNDSSVSKQKDSSRIVTSSAYLLFYRRRSNVPLGGPRFQRIIDAFDESSKEESSEEDIPESGEDQGLVGNSSLRGSSSALTGVGAAHHQTNLGSPLGGGMMTVNPRDLDGLPAYKAHEEDDDAAPLLLGDAAMNDAIPLRESIESEGSDLKSAFQPSWSFSALNISPRQPNYVSGTGSDADGADSDIVQNNSSASSASRRGRLEDFEHAVAEGDDGVFEDPSPVPDVDDEQIDNLELHRELLQGHGVHALIHPDFNVPTGDEEEIEEPATEIHVEEGEGLKMD